MHKESQSYEMCFEYRQTNGQTKVVYYNLSHTDECSMRFIGRDELICGLEGYELVEPDNKIVTPLISVGNGLSYTMSKCMRTLTSLRSLVAHAVRHGVAEAIPNTYKWGNI